MAELDATRLRSAELDRQAQREQAEQQAAAATLAAEIANLEQQLADISAENAQLEDELGVDDLAVLRQAIGEAEAAVQARLAPAVLAVAAASVPPPATLDTGDAQATLAAWQQLQHSHTQVTVALRSGHEMTTVDHEVAPEAESIAVHVLSLGGAAAWWLTIDGQRGGVVFPANAASNGLIRLLALPAAVSSIQQAFAQQRGEAPAAWLYLPAAVNAGGAQ